MQQQSGPVSQLETLTVAEQAAFERHPWVTALQRGSLSRRQYELVLWGLRGLIDGVENAVWASRSDHVVAVRSVCARMIPLLESDLVAVCGKELTVPAPINRVLDGFAASAVRGATPARLLGRLWVRERIAEVLSSGGDAVQAQLGGEGVEVTHFLGVYRGASEHSGHLAKAYQAALVGEVPMQNALEGARETFAQLRELLAVLDRSVARRAVAS